MCERTHSIPSAVISRRNEDTVNGPEWMRIQKHYSGQLIMKYRALGLAKMCIKFTSFLKSGAAKRIVESVGKFKAFHVSIVAYHKIMPKKGEEWKVESRKLRFVINPEDLAWADRLMGDLASHITDFTPSHSPTKALATLHEASTGAKIESSESAALMGRLVGANNYEIAAVIVPSNTERKALEPYSRPRPAYRPIKCDSSHAETKALSTKKAKKAAKRDPRKHHHPHAKRKPYETTTLYVNEGEQELFPIAEELVTRIATEMCHATTSRRKGGRNIFSKHRFVADAVQASFMDDAVYKRHGYKGAEDYWRSAIGVNDIGIMMNEMTESVSAQLEELDQKQIFRALDAPRPIGSEQGGGGLAKRGLPQIQALYKNALVEAPIWSHIKELAGYNGNQDDGGSYHGPSADMVAICSEYRQGPFVQREKTVPYPPRYQEALAKPLANKAIQGEEIIIFAGVREPPRHPDEGEFSSSSDEESALMDRARRGALRFPHRHAASSSSDAGSSSSGSSSSDGEERGHGRDSHNHNHHHHHNHRGAKVKAVTTVAYIDEKQYTNFFTLVRMVESDNALRGPCLVLVLPDTVLTDANLNEILNTVKQRKNTIWDFVKHYVIRLNTASAFNDIESRTNTIELVSVSRVSYKIDHGSKRIALTPEAAQKFATTPKRSEFGSIVYTAKSFPEDIRFVRIELFHKNFPRRD